MRDSSDIYDSFDVVVIGGGPAGLSAALILGRSRRRVLLAHAGPTRNATADAAHSMFTRDGTPPAELLRIGRAQLSPYDVVIRDERVVDADHAVADHTHADHADAGHTHADHADGGFIVEFENGDRARARKLLFATGVRDVLPEVKGFRELWGRGVYHCPYCHGWEVADQPLALYGNGDDGVDLAMLLRGWSRDLILFTDGSASFTDEQAAHLSRSGIGIREDPIAELRANPDGGLNAILLKSGEAVVRKGLFVHPAQEPASDLPRRLGCAITPEGRVDADAFGATNVPGVYIAGDAGPNVQQIVTAAATGAAAAVVLNRELLQQEFGADEPAGKSG